MANSLKHIGIIMDGNGRWAKKRLMPRKLGHQAGSKTFREISDHANKIGLGFLTVYAFSTENWNRPKDEVDGIMKLLSEYIDEVFSDKDEYLRKNMSIRFIGDLTRFDTTTRAKMKQIEVETAAMTGLTLSIALNYGGRLDITQAVRQLAVLVQNGKLAPDDITEDSISSHLYTVGQPDPDIIIRTGGDARLSNFLTWQSAYSEIMVTDTLWPDFKPRELDTIIAKFGTIERRFGRIEESE